MTKVLLVMLLILSACTHINTIPHISDIDFNMGHR